MSCEIFNWLWHAFRVWYSRSNRRYYDRLCRNLLNRKGIICIWTYGMRTVWNSKRHAGQNCSRMREPQWLARQFKQADECQLKRAYRHDIPVFFKSVFDRFSFMNLNCIIFERNGLCNHNISEGKLSCLNQSQCKFRTDRYCKSFST